MNQLRRIAIGALLALLTCALIGNVLFSAGLCERVRAGPLADTSYHEVLPAPPRSRPRAVAPVAVREPRPATREVKEDGTAPLPPDRQSRRRTSRNVALSAATGYAAGRTFEEICR